MKKELNSWFSPSLNKDMPIATYGDFGFALYWYRPRRLITWSMNVFNCWIALPLLLTREK